MTTRVPAQMRGLSPISGDNALQINAAIDALAARPTRSQVLARQAVDFEDRLRRGAHGAITWRRSFSSRSSLLTQSTKA